MNISRKDELEEELDLLEIFKIKTARVEGQIKQVIEKDSKLNKSVELIDSIPGFALTLSFVCAVELGPISRFKSAESVAAYAGVYPCIDSSGGRTKHGNMRRSGRRLFRWALEKELIALEELNLQLEIIIIKKQSKRKVIMQLLSQLQIN